jgi:hypothetical protein
VCKADDCDRRARNLAADYCRLHDYRLQHHGSLDKPRPHNLIDAKRCRECGYEGPDFYGYLKSICIPCYRRYQREYDAKYREQRGYGKTREWALRKKYGISLRVFMEMNEAQGGCCAICGVRAEDLRNGTLFVDHNHDTGAVRELLCSACNSVIGLARENPAIMRRAAAYIERHNGGRA